MKERFLYEDDFENQLKEKADQFKMYPSDKVWNSVYSSVHTGRRQFVAGMSLLIGGILILAGTQLIFPAKSLHSKSAVAKPAASSKPATVTDLHSFVAASLPANPLTTDNRLTEDASPYAKVPFVNAPATLAESETSAIPITESLPERILTSSVTPSVEAEDLKQVAKSSPVFHAVSSETESDNSLTRIPRGRNDRFSWEIYVAPTFNTHYLSGINYQNVRQPLVNSPIRLVDYANVNSFVDNSPLMGYDVGGNILYRISKNISLKAGIVFSFNRYYVKTYSSTQGTSVSMNTYYGYIYDSTQNAAQGLSSDKNPQHYQNRYYQFSMPIGFEMKVAGSGRVQLHVGATVQPSYLLNTDSYVLSNDYSSYDKNPAVFRRWNVNAGAEAFISYSVGNIRWEIGPQLRYQILSTYTNSYPLKENMMNYGIRIGITKTIR